MSLKDIVADLMDETVELTKNNDGDFLRVATEYLHIRNTAIEKIESLLEKETK